MQEKLNQLFPLRNIRNVSMFYVLTSVYNMWFVAGVWVFIWGRFMTKTEIGLSDAITFAIGFLIELPSGVLADIIGRKKAILIGNILLTIGNFGVAFASSFFSITTWYLLWTIGYAFQSGATEALAYDSVKKAGKEKDWDKVIGSSTVITRITSMTANAIGGLLFAAWFRLPYLIFAITGIIGIIAAYRLIEIPIKKIKNLWSIKLYFEQIKDGLSTLSKANVLPISLISLLVASMAYLYNWGLLRPLTGERFGYTAVTFPFLLVAVSVTVILTTIVFVRIKNKFKLEELLFSIAAVFTFIFFLLSQNWNWILGGILMILLSVTSSLTDQLFSQYINANTRSEHRATTLSATALLTKFPYVVLAVALGVLAEKNQLAQFCFYAGIFAMLIWLISYFKYSKLSEA